MTDFYDKGREQQKEKIYQPGDVHTKSTVNSVRAVSGLCTWCTIEKQKMYTPLRPSGMSLMLCSEAASGNLLIVECTGFAQGANDNKVKLCFAEAVESAMKQLNAANNICAVDIHPDMPTNLHHW